MAATQKPEPGTAIQMVESAAVGKLPLEVQHQLEMRKLSNQIAGKLAEMNWGQKLDLATRRAVADWGMRFRVDVTTEIHVLGGNIYLNAAFYLRRLGEMIEAGIVEYAYADHVEPDPRLAKLGAEGEGESTRRLRQRLLHKIPDEAASAVVFRVKLRTMDREITGAKWCGGGTRKSDPVGDAFPVETSESRAARRALRLIVTHVPTDTRQQIEQIEDTADELSDTLKTARQQFDEQNRAIAIEPKPLSLPAQGDPYGMPSTHSELQPEPVASEGGEARSQSQSAPASATPPSSDEPSMDELASSINRLAKHERVTEGQRKRLLEQAAAAVDADDLLEVIGKLEKIIAGTV